MAVTASTTLSATGYTPAAVKAAATVRGGDSGTGTDPLKILDAPGGNRVDWHNLESSSYTNKYWDVYEIHAYNVTDSSGRIINQWAREWFGGYERYAGYTTSNTGKTYINLSTTPVASYGQIRISGGTVTASRDYYSSSTVTLTWSINYQIAQAPIESYKNWQVYVFAQNPSGTETQSYLFNRAQTWSTGTGTRTITMSFTETSGNSTVTCRAGVWGNGTGNYNSSYNSGVSTTYTINIPAYSASPFKKYNGSAWVSVPVMTYNGSAWVACTAKRYDGSKWV